MDQFNEFVGDYYSEMAGFDDHEEEMGAMQKRMKELEEETAALREMQAKAHQKDAGAAESDSRSIFVGNVDYGCTPEEVQRHFKSCGQVNRVTIRTDKLGQPKGFAYVEFSDQQGAENALELHESVLYGRQIKVMAKRTNVPGMKQFRGRCGGGSGPRGGRYAPYGYTPRYRRAARYTPYY